jgi:threonine/homoserine/homoserine lactone efflux protein
LVPLAVIVTIDAVTLRRITRSERGAKVLEAASGVLLLIFGLAFILAPQLLS